MKFVRSQCFVVTTYQYC